MNGKQALALVILLAVVVTTLAWIFTKPARVVGDERIIDEIQRLRNITYNDKQNLTGSDLTTLQTLTAKDASASELLEEASWLVAYGEGEHATHALSSLEAYVKTGRTEVCIPHELAHIKVYLEHNDLTRAQRYIKFAKSAEADWLEDVAQSYEKYPQYYPRYDQLISNIDQAIKRLDEENYDNQTMQLLTLIDADKVC